MKKLSKITAVLIAAMMLLLTFNVSAAVIEEVASETLLNVDFAEISSLPANWSVKQADDGVSYSFNSKGISSTATDKNYLEIGYDNLINTNNKAYTVNFSVSKISSNSGSMAMVVGAEQNWSETVDKYAQNSTTTASARFIASQQGYTIFMRQTDSQDNIALYKDRTLVAASRLQSMTIVNGTGTPNTILPKYDLTLSVSENGVELYVLGTAGSGNKYEVTLTYDDETPVYSGYTGYAWLYTAGSTDGSTATLHNISIEAEASTKSTNNFYFNKQFGASDAANVTESLGFVEGTYDVTSTADGLKLLESGVNVSTLILDEYSFDGNYTISSSVDFRQNYLGYYINYQDDKNYYRLDCGKAPKTGSSELVYGYILRKCVGGTVSDLAIKDFTDANKFVFMNDTTPMIINVKNEADKVTISTVGYKNGTAFESGDLIDNTETRISSGKFGFRAGSSGNTYLKGLKIYSAVPQYTSGNAVGEDVVLSIPYMPWSSDESKVITAVYKNDATKELVTTSMKSISDFASGAVEVAPSSYNKADYQIKTFIWDSLDTMKPLTAPVVLAE